MRIRALASILLLAAGACSSEPPETLPKPTPSPTVPPVDCSATPLAEGCPPPVDCTATPRPAGCAPPIDECLLTPDAPECKPPPKPIDCTQTPTIAECQPQVECNEMPALPVDAVRWLGDAHAPRERAHDTDLVFDGRGNLFGADAAGNVFRQGRDGARTVVAARAVKTARGMVFLSTGELIVADSGLGRLIAVYPDGQVRTLVPHLDFPSGLEVDRGDRIYIAERLRQVISRFDPATRTSTIVASGLGFQPAAIAFSDDEDTLYAVDEEGDTVYALERTADNRWGPPTVFVAGGGGGGGVDGCAGRPAGSGCAAQGRAGSCEPTGPTGVITCTVREPCEGRRPGDVCRGDFFETGTCVSAGRVLNCEQPAICATARAGAACFVGDRIGSCQEQLPGQPRSCVLESPCAGRLPGDACDEGGFRGVCDIIRGSSALACSLVGECFRSNPGDACVDGFGGAGICTFDGGGGMFCAVPDPCVGAQPNAACTAFGSAGQCLPDGFGGLTCTPSEPCAALAVGDACTTLQGDAGRCEDGGRGTPVCIASSSCATAPELSACTQNGLPGLCMDDFRGGLYCQTTTQCAERSVGDVCRDPETIGSGLCAKTPAGRAYCASSKPCAADAMGDRCWSPYTPGGGLCALGPRSPYCAPVAAAESCEGGSAGDPCSADDGGPGTCVSRGGTLICEAAACGDRVVGGICQTGGNQGLCVNDGGDFVCATAEPCAGLQAGAACTHTTGGTGTCADDGRGGNFCRYAPDCAGRASGASCTARDSGLPGTCRARAGGALLCDVASPCAGRIAGQGCTGRLGALGVCTASTQGGVLSCQTTGGSRLLPRAIETDACGWLYVSDASSGDLYRYSRDGVTKQLVSRTQYGPITSLTWTSSVAGWKGRTLYAGTRGGGGLLELELGVTPRRIAFPTATPVAGPATPPPAVDCLNLPYAPISVTELNRPRGYHDVAFTDDGEIVGSDGSALVAVDRMDNLRPYAPTGRVEGVDRLTDGTMIAASGDGIVSISVDGAITPLAPGVSAYGVTVGPDQKVYVGTNGALLRIDPVTRLTTTYLDPTVLPTSFQARTINFDIDHSLMFIGSFGDSVFVLPIDENLDPLAAPRRFTRVRSGGPFLDGLGVDACGNVYIPSFSHSALYRVAPDGELRMYWNVELNQYGHGIRFGSGIGGWRDDAAYLPQPYDGSTVVEVVTGVGGRR